MHRMSNTVFLKTQLASNYFEVRNEVSIKMGENDFQAFSTYDIFMKKTEDENYDLLIDRLKFRVNGAEIENKFSKVSDDYFKCIFPIKFEVVENQLQLVNYAEINKRIAEKDEQLQNNMEGEGLAYIRSQFLESTNTPEKLQQLILSLGIVKIINISLQRYSPEKTIFLEWTAPIIGKTFWKTPNDLSNQNLEGNYSYENNSHDKLLEFFNQYRIENKLEKIKENVSVRSNLKHEMNYVNDSFFFSESKTEVSIKIENYLNYEETITLKSMI